MNKIKSLVAGMAAAVLAIVLIACGGQKQEATDKEKLIAILEGMDAEQITSLLATIQRKA